MGDLALDLDIFGVAVGLENLMQDPEDKDAAKKVLRQLDRDAKAERRYEERQRGA